ncbi:MAG: hypothetical protein AAGF60_03010, partial [Pseudomonadota bacterium]
TARWPSFSRASTIWRRWLCTSLLVLAGAAQAAPGIQTETQKGAAALRAMHAEAAAFIEAQFGLTPPTTFTLVAAGDPDALTAQFDAAGIRTLFFTGDRTCPPARVGGVANRAMIALCWNEGPVTTPQARAVMVHELMHQVQYTLANNRPARPLGQGDWLLGPAWMVEGSAEWVEEVFRNGRATDGTRLFELQEPARRNQTPLSQLSVHGSLATGRTYGVARFAAYVLAERFGDQALFDYFSALGRLADRDAAFREVFGMSIAAFEEEFERIRRHYGDARRWAGVAE